MMVDREPLDDRPRCSRPVREALLIVVGCLAVAAVALWWIGREPPHRRPSFAGDPGSGRESLGDYVGHRACGVCHPGESAHHSRSGHSRTLRPAADLPVARHLDGRTVADPESPAVSWSYGHRDGDFLVERREAGAVERFVLDYAFGSGQHATTFVTLVDPSTPVVLEHRLTHYSDGDALKITPGQRAAAPSPGRPRRAGGRRRRTRSSASGATPPGPRPRAWAWTWGK